MVTGIYLIIITFYKFNIGLHISTLKVKINLNIKQFYFTISNLFTIIYVSVYIDSCKYVHQLTKLAFLPAGEGIIPA